MKMYLPEATPSERIEAVYERIARQPLAPVWITLNPKEKALERARDLEQDGAANAMPLYGVPFAVKDNIDVAGLPTTAACPAFSYVSTMSATVVQRLEAAGAILVGKTNMDQFATGLVGTRSPHGACSSVFDDRYISGGSSSGSAVAVAKELVSFSLGTDTAGSGRVPAAFNHLVGLKPTRGRLSAHGVVPACRTLDCVSIFAHTPADAAEVLAAAQGLDPKDPYSRTPAPGAGAAPWLGKSFRFGVPPANQREFFGDKEASKLYEDAIGHLCKLGGTPVEIDFSLFRATADLLYQGPWVSERTAALGSFLNEHGDGMDPVVRQIIEGGTRYTAVQAFEAEYKLAELRRATGDEWGKMDVLFLPTTGTIYTKNQIAADPIRLNSNLGYYTNFVNLLDLAAIALPAGFRSNGLPFGVSLVGPAFSDDALLALGSAYISGNRETGQGTGCVDVAVVGAHLSGQPLNYQLIQRGARLARTTRTTSHYRLFALPGTEPPKPGMVRDPHWTGPGVELEIWTMPEQHFGGFVAAVPSPLSIGDVQLTGGSRVKCFLCESAALTGAEEITSYGGWRAYLAALTDKRKER